MEKLPFLISEQQVAEGMFWMRDAGVYVRVPCAPSILPDAVLCSVIGRGVNAVKAVVPARK